MSLVELFRKYAIYNMIFELVLSILIPVIFFFYVLPRTIFSFILYDPQLVWFRWFLLFFIIFGVSIKSIITVISIKKHAKLDLREKPLIIPKIKGIQPSGERILTTLFGVTKQFTGRVWNSDVLFGLGETKNPENSIIITNKRIIFAVIPLHGQGKYVGGEDISSWNFLFGRKYIKKKGEEIIDMMNPQEILEFDKNNFEIPLNQLKEVKIKNFFDRSVTFFTNDGKKFKYVTGKKEHIIKIKDVLSSYILSK